MSWQTHVAGLLSLAAAQLHGPAQATPAATTMGPFRVPGNRGAEEVEEAEERERAVRRLFGGNIAPPPTTVTRWHLADLEAAQHEADTGNLQRAAQLCRSMRRDGVLAGVLSTCTGGLVRLPKRFSGDPKMVAVLEGRNHRRGLFDRMFPAPEIAMLLGDGILLGVGVAQMLEVDGLDHKVMVRLPPEYLKYNWALNRWFYSSLAGLLPIEPGDGTWILHLPGAGNEPWNNGLWYALGKAYIDKEHALAYRSNYNAKLANAARVAVSPQGASDEQHQAWFQKVMAWGVNTVFGMKPGYDVKLVESNGRGYECFKQSIVDSNEAIIIALGSSPVLVDGGTGFANADVHKSIRADVIAERADSIAYTLNTQGIPPWVNERYGAEALDEAPIVEWDVRPPKDMKAEADSLAAAAGAVKAWNEVLEPYGKRVDDAEIEQRFGVPIEGDFDGDGQPEEAPEELEEAA